METNNNKTQNIDRIADFNYYKTLYPNLTIEMFIKCESAFKEECEYDPCDHLDDYDLYDDYYDYYHR